jgi:2-dehydropantoate 2-reductase
MKICIFGAGAIGGLIGARLALAGQEVSFIARGPHLAAMKANGVTLISGGERMVARPFCTDDPAAAGPQDYVIVTLKATALPGTANAIRPLLGPGTAVVTAMNGIPWWYFHKLPGPFENRRLDSVDPGGRVWEALPPERAIGCVVYPAAEVVEPGVIEHTYGDRFMLGEPDGSRSERVQKLSRAMIEAGLKAPVRTAIRDDIWLKLWGNLALNPMSVLTTATLDVLTGDPATREVARTMMAEAQVVAEKLGAKFSLSLDKRLDGAAAVGAHRTSMLQVAGCYPV